MVWVVRHSDEGVDLQDLYFGFPNMFSMKIHHNGSFKNFPGRIYTKGKFFFADACDIDLFSVHEIDDIMKKLHVIEEDEVLYYHFMIPGTDLDFGLVPLGNDSDVLELGKYISDHKLIDVYIEHGVTRLNNYFTSPHRPKVVIEELTEVRDQSFKGNKSDEPDQTVKGKSKVKRKSKETVECPWVLYASKEKVDESWVIKTYKPQHTCHRTRKVRAFTAGFMAKQSWVMNQIESNPTVTTKSIREELQRKFEIGVSRQKAFRARSIAKGQLKSDYVDQYDRLRDYIQEVKSNNPNTTVKLLFEDEDNPNVETRTFKRAYICLGALKEGFKACRRELLGLDGAFMKGPYPSQLLSAVGVDPNNGIYPVAYAIVESENKESWIWFLECLADDLNLSKNSNFTFISDRQKGIIPALAHVLPAAQHRFCLRHIHQNMKEEWRGQAYKDLLWGCATATTVPEFKKKMEELKKYNVRAYNWLVKIPPHHWTRSHFTGREKTDMLLNNICEVFNSKILEGREKPIISAIEYVREYLMKRIGVVNNVISKSKGPLTPTATKLLDGIKSQAVGYNVLWSGDKYQVKGPWDDQCVVSVSDMTCSCRRWELTGLPCKHAVAVNWEMALNGQQVGPPESWAHPCHTLETWKSVYAFKIGPINGRSMWPKFEYPTTLLPPVYKVPVGRPKKARRKNNVEIEDQMELNGKLTRRYKTVTCSKCHKYGHNSRSCKGQSSNHGAGGQGSSRLGVGGQGSSKQVAGQRASRKRTFNVPTQRPSVDAANQGPPKKGRGPTKKVFNNEGVKGSTSKGPGKGASKKVPTKKLPTKKVAAGKGAAKKG